MAFKGTFHRRKSPTQTDETALLQVKSAEIWGRTPRGGFVPTVQAYPGPIEPGKLGVDFDTTVDPKPNGSPFEARWYLGETPGVEERWKGDEQFASIAAKVRNHQS